MREPDIAALTESGKITAEVLEVLATAVKPGVSLLELDILAESGIRDRGGVPAFLGHQGFPNTLCTSVNAGVVHGIPTEYELKEGDIVSLDLGAKVRGWYSDAAITVGVGAVSPEAAELLDVAREALRIALEHARPGQTTGDLGAAVQEYVELHGFGIVRECSGHGLGLSLHEDPSIPNFGTPGRGTAFKPGMVVAIEPIIAAGDPALAQEPDHWTLKTRDGSLAAHEETSVLITEDGHIDLVPVPERLRGQKSVAKLGGVT